MKKPKISTCYFVTGFGPITIGCLYTGEIDGVKHFALWPLAQAAESCFATDQWPSTLAVPQAWIEFDVDDIEKPTAELKSQGYELLVATRKEPGNSRENGKTKATWLVITHHRKEPMKTSKIIVFSHLLLAASLLTSSDEAFAQQPKPEQSVNAYQLSGADESAIREIIKGLETAWNKHDMKAFTKSFRDDAEGINVVGMYWSGKAAVLKHLTDYHDGVFKNLEETLEEVKVHSIGDGYAIAVSTWKVGSFKAPGGVEMPASHHRSTLVLAKGTDGWKVVHFHNTIIDEAAAKDVTIPPKN